MLRHYLARLLIDFEAIWIPAVFGKDKAMLENYTKGHHSISAQSKSAPVIESFLDKSPPIKGLNYNLKST